MKEKNNKTKQKRAVAGMIMILFLEQRSYDKLTRVKKNQISEKEKIHLDKSYATIFTL